MDFQSLHIQKPFMVHLEAFYGANMFFKHHPIQFHDYIWGPHTVAEARLRVPVAVSVIHMLTVGLVDSSALKVPHPPPNPTMRRACCP